MRARQGTFARGRWRWMVKQRRRPNLGEFRLVRGGSAHAGTRVCLMQAVACWAGLRHTDHPPRVSPVLNAFGIMLNDSFSDDARQRLVPFIPRLVDSQNPSLERDRRRVLMGRPSGRERGRPREGRTDRATGLLTASSLPPSWNEWAREVLVGLPKPVHGSFAHTMPAMLIHDLRRGLDANATDELLDRFDQAIALGETVPWRLEL